jgi:NitT/TauT family transport system ATP-binding protein
VLEVSNVRKSYGYAPRDYVALEGVNLAIREGEFFCLLGSSGCGKSTLLNVMAGFEPVSAGTVTFQGVPVRGADRDRLMLFQDANSALFPWLTVQENVRFGLKLRKVAKTEWDGIIDSTLSMVDLDRHREKFPSQLSGGMRQRLQIARGLAVNPAMLLMDEPFAALDALTRKRMHTVLLDIWHRTRKTIVFVTHDIAEAIALADRIGMMAIGPRSSVSRLIDVDLPRPRDLSDPRVSALYNQIEAELAPDAAKAELLGVAH